MAHTSGPWELINHEEAGCHAVMAQPHPALRGFTKEVAYVWSGEDDARLIKAAPAMLAELERLHELYGNQKTADVLALATPTTQE